MNRITEIKKKDISMINCKFLSYLTFIILVYPLLIHAEFYKYVDSQGVTRFTYNLADVPEKQRKEVDHYEESLNIPKVPLSETESVVPTGKKPEISAKKEATLSEKQIKHIRHFGNKLLDLQKLLNKEYQKLAEDKKALELKDSVPGPKKKAVVQKLHEQAEKLNKRIEKYNRLKAKYKDEILQYQQKIKNTSTEKRDE
jgi:chaperonin cofactor prefoldin